MMHGPTQGHKAMSTELLSFMDWSFFLLHFYWLRNVLLRVISPFVEFHSIDGIFLGNMLTSTTAATTSCRRRQQQQQVQQAVGGHNSNNNNNKLFRTAPTAATTTS